MLTHFMLSDVGPYDLTFVNEVGLLYLVSRYLAHADPTPELGKRILAFHLSQLQCDLDLDVAPVTLHLIVNCCTYLDRLQNLVSIPLVGMQAS